MPARQEDCSKLATCLEQQKRTIITKWRHRVLDDPEIPRANELAEPLLIDHIPEFIDAISDSLVKAGRGEDAKDVGKKVGQGETSRQHAKLRILANYSLPEALRELSHLRSVIVETCHDSSFDPAAFVTAHTAIDHAMGEIANEISSLRMLAERELWEARGQLQTMLDGVPDHAIFMTDTRGRILNWNPGVEEVLGYKREQFVGQDISILFTKEDVQNGLPQEVTGRALEDGKVTLERVHPRRDGTTFWAEDTKAVIRKDGVVEGFAKVICDRTLQKKNEEALCASEERYRLLMDNIRDHAIFTLDPDGRISDWSIGAEAITGFTAEDVLGQNVELLFVPEDRAAGVPAKELAKAAREGRAEDIRWHMRKDGSRFWANGFTSALYDREGRLRGFSKIARDDTARHLALNGLATSEARLRESQEHLTLTQEAANLTSWDWDLRTGELQWGSNAAQLYGFPPPLSASALLEIMDSRDRERFLGASQKSVRDKSLFTAEFRVFDANGEIKWMLAKGRPFFDESGNADRILGINMEITERKRAETERDRYFELSADLLAIADGNGMFKRLNPVWEKALGYSLEELYQRPYIDFVHPDDRASTLEIARRAMSGETIERFENRYRHRDGSYRWLLWATRYDAERDLLFASARDETEHKQWEERLAKATAAAEEANRSKSTFLASMSHEIRTPLGAILGFSELLKLPDLPPEKRTQFTDAIARNSRELGRLIDEILDLSKVEAGHIDIELLDISIVDLLEDVHTSLMPKAKEKGIDFYVQRDLDAPETIRSDPTRLRQILLNIVGNAIKFTDKGTVTVTAKMVSHDGPDIDVQFVVQDTGIGIAQEAREKIFQPFAQAESSITRRYGGTGLGLVLAKQLAALLSGDVILSESRPGLGSTFIVTIRSGRGEQDGQNSSDDSETKEKTEALALDSVDILVVEDSLDNQQIARIVLEAAGAQVRIANNGEEGVAEALSNPPDVVLMDIAMPIMDGYAATRELRKKGFVRPIIALTAHAMQGEREKSLAAGCNDYITKPFDQVRLVALIVETLQRSPR